MGREFELKYAATAQALQAIAAQYGNFREIRMETTYFDTTEHILAAQRATLRLRRENEQTICTLKTALPDGSRGEWECPAEDIRTGLTHLIQLGAPAQFAAVANTVTAVCGARFTRLAATIATDDGEAELALDQGVLLGGGKEIPLCEVEVELKSGSDAALVALAVGLAKRFDLQPEANSKFRRAMNLAAGE